jgi:histidinol dehydrogenase
LRIVFGAEEARRTVLKRAPLEELAPSPEVRERTRRVFGEELSPERAVERILRDVREEGDAAVRRYNELIDGAETPRLEVSRSEIEDALRDVDKKVVSALRFAADRIRSFHELQRARSMAAFSEKGLGVMVRPLERVGVYVPGTTAVYPSSVLMTAIPARVAGVGEVVMVSPVDPQGRVAPLKLAAAEIVGVDRVFRAGGAQAVAALAYGTESVPRVDKICGPGGLFVTLAKRLVFGSVGIDAIYGPTETVVIADDSADPALCAADLLAQAEHDELATAILITTSEAVAQATAQEVEEQLSSLDRAAVASAALEARGGAVVVKDLSQAMELANEFAPEHLCLLMKDAQRWASRVRNAGGVFVGESSPESLGDYTAGPSHVMPSAGTARFASPLGVHDFLKSTSVVSVDDKALRAWGPAAATIARAEGFTAHARSIEARLEEEEGGDSGR